MSLFGETKELRDIRDSYKKMLTDIVIDNTSNEDIVIYKAWIDQWVALSLYEILYLKNDYVTDVDEYYKVKFVTEFNCMKTGNRIFGYGKSDKNVVN